MDVSGIVVAASEVIRFEKGLGLIFCVCNTCMNLYFYILVKDSLIKLWRNICVNHIYSFSNLKVGAIELLSGTRRKTFIATLKSEFEEIMEADLKEIQMSSNLIKLMSIPKVILNSETCSLPKLISYQGIVTKVKNSNLGLYEVDGKIHLYCIFNSFRSVLPVLEEGATVFISNAHFFIDFMDRKNLVCCGLSSVRSLDRREENVNNPLSASLCHYSFSIFDVVWMEMLLAKLNVKFRASIISSDYCFDWKNEILINEILKCFDLSIKRSSLPSRRNSIGDEFFSSPHLCDVFCDDILPTGCEILQITEILDKASDEISWTENTDNWEISFVKNEPKFVLVGILYLSKDGCWYIMDESSDIPVMFIQNCSQCTFSKNTLCSFDDLNLGYLTVLQNFDIVHEKIKFNSNSYNYYRYLKSVCCYPICFGKFFKGKDNLFHPFPTEISCHSKTMQYCSVDEIASLLENIHFDKQDLLTNVKENSISHFEEDLNNNVSCQYFLVLNKIWTIIDQVFVSYQILVLLLPQEEVFKEYFDKSRSLFQDTTNFYETDDDYDFADLVSQMDSLFLEDKPMLARLHFESTGQCAVLLPGHIYSTNFANNFNQDAKFSVISNKNGLKPVLIKIKPNMKVLHHSECFGNHSPDDYETNVYCSIKEIISKRKVRENSLIKAVLKDKCYEEYINSCSSFSEVVVNKTFCMVLKDSDSDDTIKVYLPFCPKILYGFVPGIQLQMYGFICMCSKRGYLYLKPTSSFAIQTINFKPSYCKDASLNSLTDDFYPDEKLKLASLWIAQAGTFFKCICFIMKIISVKLNLICLSCGKDFEQKCLCFCNYSVKLIVSFIIDDGTEQMLVYSTDEAARKILMLNVEEMEKLSSFVTETKSHITFHYKLTEKEINCASMIDDVFSVYCSSKFLCRQVCLKCKKKSNSRKNEQQTIWCYDVFQMTETDLIAEFLVELERINS